MATTSRSWLQDCRSVIFKSNLFAVHRIDPVHLFFQDDHSDRSLKLKIYHILSKSPQITGFSEGILILSKILHDLPEHQLIVTVVSGGDVLVFSTVLMMYLGYIW